MRMWVGCGLIVPSGRSVRGGTTTLEDPMATIVSTLFISLDGVAEIDPAWHFPYFDENMGAAVGEDYEDVDVLLLGRVTYDSFAGAWPDREAAGGEDATFAAQLGDMRKVVATRGARTSAGATSSGIDGDLVEAVDRARRPTPASARSSSPGRSPSCASCSPPGCSTSCACSCTPSPPARASGCSTTASAIYPLRLLRSEVFPTGVVRLVYAPSELPPAATYDDVTDKVPGAGDG